MGSEDGALSLLATVAGPRVLHVVPTGLGRGAQVFARALVDQLGGAPAGHHLVSLFDGESDVRVDETFGLPGGVRAAEGLHPAAIAALVVRLHASEHDVVVAHGGDAFKYLALAARAPLAYCVIGTWPAGNRDRFRRTAWSVLARRAWVAAAVSDDVATDCRDVLRFPPERVIVIPNGRDDARFVPAGESVGRATTLLFIGRLTAGKRPDLFVVLVERLRAQGLPVSARMVGEGPMQSALEPRATRAGIEMLGWCADVVAHLQEADVLVFPSAPDGEGMPGVLIEAGLCGLPAVATRVPGAASVIEHGQTGLLVDVDDLEALVSSTAELVQDPRRLADMSAAARDRCRKKFALHVVAQRWDQLLRGAPVRRRRSERRVEGVHR